MMAKKKPMIKLTLVKSPIGRKPEQRATVKALGLGKMNSTVEKEANAAVMGMVSAISHLVRVEEL